MRKNPARLAGFYDSVIKDGDTKFFCVTIKRLSSKD